MKFTLRSGQTIETFRTDSGTEFVTRDASGAVISTVRPSAAVASALVMKLEGGVAR